MGGCTGLGGSQPLTGAEWDTAQFDTFTEAGGARQIVHGAGASWVLAGNAAAGVISAPLPTLLRSEGLGAASEPAALDGVTWHPVDLLELGLSAEFRGDAVLASDTDSIVLVLAENETERLPWVFLGDGQTWTTITPDEFGTTWDWGEHGKGEIGRILSADIDGDHLTVVFEARWGNDAEESGIAVASWGPDGPSTTVSRPRTPLPSALGYAHVVRHDAGIAVLASTRNVAGAVAQVVQWQLDASSWMASDVTSGDSAIRGQIWSVVKTDAAFIAIGERMPDGDGLSTGLLLRSENGRDWEEIETPISSPIGYAVATDHGFYAFTYRVSPATWFSATGRDWVRLDAEVPEGLRAFTSSPGGLVALTDDGVAISPKGQSPTPAAAEQNASDRILGVDWAALHNADLAARGINTDNAQLTYAAGAFWLTYGPERTTYQDTVLRSPDGISWEDISLDELVPLNSAANWTIRVGGNDNTVAVLAVESVDLLSAPRDQHQHPQVYGLTGDGESWDVTSPSDFGKWILGDTGGYFMANHRAGTPVVRADGTITAVGSMSWYRPRDTADSSLWAATWSPSGATLTAANTGALGGREFQKWVHAAALGDTVHLVFSRSVCDGGCTERFEHAHSSDGITWTASRPLSSPLDIRLTGALTGQLAGASGIVAFGKESDTIQARGESLVLFSRDGATWSKGTLGAGIIDFVVPQGDTLFAYRDDEEASQHTLHTSTDGENWDEGVRVQATRYFTDMVASPDLMVGIATGGRIYLSTP